MCVMALTANVGLHDQNVLRGGGGGIRAEVRVRVRGVCSTKWLFSDAMVVNNSVIKFCNVQVKE